MNIIKLETPEFQNIELSKAEQIKNTFAPMAKMLLEFETAYNEILTEKSISLELTNSAKELRKKIAKVRIETEKIRKTQKSEYLIAGKAIDGVSNILKWAISEKESKLKEIENYFEIQESKRLELLQNERVEEISLFLEDASERNLSSMEDDVWTAYFATKKKDYQDKIEAEKQAEAERISKEKQEKAEAERILKENEELKKEAEIKEKARIKELEKIRIEQENKERIEKERIEKLVQIENEKRKKEDIERKKLAKIESDKHAKIQKELKEKAKQERIEKERIEKQLKAKQEAELKAKQEAELKLQSELRKGDAEKVKDLIADLKALKTKYSFKSKKNEKMYKGVNILISKVIGYVQK